MTRRPPLNAGTIETQHPDSECDSNRFWQRKLDAVQCRNEIGATGAGQRRSKFEQSDRGRQHQACRVLVDRQIPARSQSCRQRREEDRVPSPITCTGAMVLANRQTS